MTTETRGKVKIKLFTSGVTFTLSETMDKLNKDGSPAVEFTRRSGAHLGVSSHLQAELSPEWDRSKNDKVIIDGLDNIERDLVDLYDSLDVEPVSNFSVMSFDCSTTKEGHYKVVTPHLKKDESGQLISDDCLFMNLGPSGVKYFPMGYMETPAPLFIHSSVITPTPRDGSGRTYFMSDGPTKILFQELRHKS